VPPTGVLACWHVVIPYIAAELPDSQKQALASAQKSSAPLQQVLIPQLDCIPEAGRELCVLPFHVSLVLESDLPVSIGGYECTKNPDEAIVVSMSSYRAGLAHLTAARGWGVRACKPLSSCELTPSLTIRVHSSGPRSETGKSRFKYEWIHGSSTQSSRPASGMQSSADQDVVVKERNFLRRSESLFLRVGSSAAI